MFDTNGIIFEEQYNNDNYHTATLYFNAPKELLNAFCIECEEADGCTISLEFDDYDCKGHCYASISPTVDGEDIGYEDFDIMDDEVMAMLEIWSNSPDKVIIWNG